MIGVERFWKQAFLCIMLLVLLDRLWILVLTMGDANDDMTIFWLAAMDYSHGVFREPFFYGQDYSVMLESVLAVPLIRAGVNVTVAVPIAMAFIAIIPFWSFALWHRLRGEVMPALLFAVMPVLLPVEHALNQMVGSGLAVLSLFPWVQLLRRPLLRSCLSAIVLAASVVVQSNAMPFAFALGLCSLVENRKRYVWGAFMVGCSFVAVAWWKARQFYAGLSGGVVNSVYGSWSEFDPELLMKTFTRLDAHFAGLSPVWWANGSIAFLLLVLLTVILFVQRKVGYAIGMLGALLILMFGFGFKKIHDGTSSVFFPLFRMFMSVPLLNCWALSALRADWLERTIPRIIAMAIILVCASMRFMGAGSTYETARSDQRSIPLRVRPVAWIRATCDEVVQEARSGKSDIIVAPRDVEEFTAHFIAYGVPALHPEAPPTYLPDHERRYWRRTEKNVVAERRILVARAVGPEVWTRSGLILPSLRFDHLVTPATTLDPSLWGDIER